MGKMEQEKPLSVSQWLDLYMVARVHNIGAFEELMRERTLAAKKALVATEHNLVMVLERFPVVLREKAQPNP